jgi:hypothetical protein
VNPVYGFSLVQITLKVHFDHQNLIENSSAPTFAKVMSPFYLKHKPMAPTILERAPNFADDFFNSAYRSLETWFIFYKMDCQSNTKPSEKDHDLLTRDSNPGPLDLGPYYLATFETYHISSPFSFAAKFQRFVSQKKVKTSQEIKQQSQLFFFCLPNL